MAVKPKLALIPSGIRNSKVYSVLPSNGDGDFYFSRGSSATKLNKEGLIEMVDDDLPRLNYATNGDCPNLLLEPLRQNYIVGSNHFQDWTTNGTVERNADFGISPDGTQNSVNVNFSNFGRIYRSPNRPLGNYVFSVFAKKVDGTDSLLTLRLDTPIEKIGIFNLETGSKVFNSSDEASIENYGNGWYRCSITLYDYEVINAVIGEGQNSLNCELYGAQLEESRLLTSYIETPQNAIATRNADICLLNVPNAKMINDNEGVLFFEGTVLDDGLASYIEVSNGLILSDIECFRLTFSNGVKGRVEAQFQGTNNQLVSISDDGIDLSVNHKFALRYKNNIITLFIDGDLSDSASYTGDLTYTLNELNFYTTFLFSPVPFFGTCKQLKYYDKGLTDSELIQLTTND